MRSTSTSAPTLAGFTGNRRTASSHRHGRELLIGVTTIGLILTAACSGHSTTITSASTSPINTPKASASSSATPSSMAAAAVAAAYTGFFPAANAALRGIRGPLGGYATGRFLDFQYRQLDNQRAQHLEPWGHVVAHITSIDIRRDKATVRDCQDASNAGLATGQTHQLIPELRGSAHRNLIAMLIRRGDGRWRLSNLRQLESMCHLNGANAHETAGGSADEGCPVLGAMVVCSRCPDPEGAGCNAKLTVVKPMWSRRR